MNQRIWNFLDGASLVLLVVAAFSQLDVTQLGRDTLAEGLGYATKTLKLAVSDAVFALVLLYFIVRTLQMRAWKRLWWPPLPCFALIFALVLSALASPTIGVSLQNEGGLLTKEIKEAVAEIAQWSGYFLFAPWLVVNLLFDRRADVLAPINRVDLAVRALFFAVLASGFVALIQAGNFTESAPRGLWTSPNAYAAAFAFVLPLLLEWEPKTERSPLRTALLALVAVVLALGTFASPWALGAALLGMIVALLVRGGGQKVQAFRLAMVVGLALVAVVTWRLPGTLRPYRAEFARVASAEAPVKKQYVEWGAALGWSIPTSQERVFLTGFGPGNYQLNIGKLYVMLPNEERMPPDSNNLYFVQAISIGVFGLAMLAWVWGHFASLAWHARRNWLGAGVLGSLVAWAFVNLFHALIVRGAGLILAFVFALAAVASLQISNETNAEESEQSEQRHENL